MTSKTINYITSSLEERKRKENTLHGRDLVMIINPLPDHVNVDSVLRRIESYVPSALTQEIDAIYIGEFEILQQREIQALYYHGTIYVTNEQDDENDLLDDLVHEIAHAAESLLKNEIYGDGAIEKEFQNKRLKLLDIFHEVGYDVDMKSMLKSEYDPDFDNFLYWEVGYERLDYLINGLFISPYSVTSLREYWAKGFEAYALGDKVELKEVSPVLYNKLEIVYSNLEGA
tara:strand:- start:5676 stop:6365 length:690 start_codon:yes stop_codon:yes gene_type:complete